MIHVNRVWDLEVLTPYGICFPATTISSGLKTLLASGIVKTGVIRKLALMQFFNYGQGHSAAETEYDYEQLLPSISKPGRTMESVEYSGVNQKVRD